MEIYRNDTANVDLKVPVSAVNGTFEVIAYEGDTAMYTFPTPTQIPGGYRVVLPFSLVDHDKTLNIKWKFDYTQDSQTKTYEYSTVVDVVTPYVTLDEIKEAIPEAETLSDVELKRLERRIRGVIERYTGQYFGRYIGTRTIIGAGDGELKLDSRLVRLSNISGANILYESDGVAATGFYSVRGDGWYVGVSNPTPDGDYVFENVIRDPDSMWARPGFKDNMVYDVTGTWGWDDVPAEVKEAALILCEDEICPQAEYRDRYLKSISGDGWRYEFTPNAYYGTGSVIADQLLEKFRNFSMTVI
ncbi:head-to-tail connector complex protein [Streptomyces phage Annadreamy]|uniref:Head-to-tail connector complex protein n=2 Tax=Annadreamyvirus annadreamy TaxID=2846392 RepID=A0A345GT78_9CAUD|nr:head-to-tail connector complex protein [Streptomyces phage Annadreamy]AXG66150.1 head-to-tail connector complex protein [Streptomyces phage Annadreamy]QGH79362.1 head-to-tail adaptor [Streptomyces phage Limpid]